MTTTTYSVWTAKGGKGEAPVQTATVRTGIATMAEAQKIAKRAAGRGAKFGTRGVDSYYATPACTAWIESRTVISK